MRFHPDRFLLMPDTPVGGTATPAEPVRTPRLPTKDDDIARVAKVVNTKWAATPQITLLWITQHDFENQVSAFAASLQGRQSTGSNRPAQTQALRNLDDKAEEGISSVKLDIQKRFGKEDGYAQYRRYGLEKRGKNYEFPRDRDQRLAALKLIPNALTVDGISGAPYDKAFWQRLITDYQQALDKANNTDSDVSGLVGEKNTQKEAILKTMRALQLVIQGNYPDTFEAAYREWGWQKEDY